ncbi:SMI1/KNR4 family protein [Nannocystis bainbridge]|uniref:SMI1/KNR4 family protein n=1 Tax=Nannocystis bainbridge TaxID=2995303 RepID=A0ABT5DTR3_9BACT|nr:SMI1/KNR4 family protein [Nannocystis bainbridge]MDC0715802.1 SMI1/KNR4 family protein [Nannocystis bainbridge]
MSKKTAKSAAGKTAKSASKKAAKQPVAPRTAEEVFVEVEARAEEVGVELRDGASAREIARTEKALGVTLPEDVRAWYRRHDGSAGDDFPYLWPLAFIREQQRYLADLLDAQWFVLGGIEDSVSCIDLSPAGAGRIFHCSAESDPRRESDGFLEWLASFSWDWDLD